MKEKIISALFFFIIATFVAGALGVSMLPLPGDIPVLMYHFVGTKKDAAMSKNYVSFEGFQRQMNFLKKFGFHVLSMEEYEETLTGKRKPQGKEVVITFDDGHYSFIEQAWPVLQFESFPVTVFVISDHVRRGTKETGSMELPTLKLLLGNPLVTFGSHSRTHPALKDLGDEEVDQEVIGSKKELEQMLGTTVDYFAYPTGIYDPRAINAVKKAGYHLAFTTSPKKLIGPGAGPYELLRVKMTRSADNPLVFWFKVSGLYQALKKTRAGK